MRCLSTLFAILVAFLCSVQAQESSNQNQSDTLINKEISLPLLTSSNVTFCKQYIPEGTSQWEWMYKLVYTAFTGQYAPLANPSAYQAQGILNASAYYRDPIGNVNKVNLLKWFDGSLASSNRCDKPTAVRFVNGNGTKWEDGMLKIRATPVMDVVLGHLTEYLGSILGCTDQSFPKYTGQPSQFEVHRFMDLPAVEMHYFIHNIYDSALNQNVSQVDGIIIGTALDNMFNKQCAPPKQIVPYQEANYQNMCLNSTCAFWVLGNATCSPYNVTGAGQEPAPADPSKAQTVWNPLCR